jgi:hypothetical protein
MPLWIPFVVLCVGALVFARDLARSASAHGVATIDTRSYKLHSGMQWVSPSWRDRLERVLDARRGLSANDREAIQDLTREIETLSFVAEVGAAEVVWPDGLRVPVRLQRPVACIGSRGEFLPLAEDGTVLDGYSYSPPDAYGAWLPVLGPNDGSLNHVRPGDVLGDVTDRDALAVAISMWNHLKPEDIRELGRLKIDASQTHAYDGLPGGVVIDLERKRRILFGRPPGSGIPGELPARFKWRSVERALDRLRRGEDWALFDARWDEPVALGGAQDLLD